MTERERELFTLTEYTRPVDFHSFRRQFKQSLADAGVDIQLSMALSGATDPSAHRRYLTNTAKARQLPQSSLSSFSIDHAETVLEAANENGQISLISQCRRADLNRRQRAYEGGYLSESAEIYGERQISGPCRDPVQSAVVCEPGQNSRDETPGWVAIAADAALSAYLRGIADWIAAEFIAQSTFERRPRVG